MHVKFIALLGHKDHGKSTLIGSLLMQTGAATKVRIKEAEEYSKRLHKAFEPAFILDSFAEERLQEMTIDTTRAEIKHRNLAFALIDVPGHEELIKNMISGASYGEIALLLVSAKRDEGIRDQTKRHLFISRMLGIDRLVVAVNKMDTVDYDEGRFVEVKEGLVKFIEKIGFDTPNVAFVPISAYKGENLVRKSREMRWYSGKPLLDALYASATKTNKTQDGALRIIAQGVIPGKKSNLIVGRVISGKIKVGEKISILPLGIDAKTRAIIVKNRSVGTGNVGENVALELDTPISGNPRGAVISGSRDKPAVKDAVKLRIFVTGKLGDGMTAKFNGIDIPCKGIRVLRSVSTTTGDAGKSKTAKALEAAEAELRLARKVPIENYEVTKELGRFVLYRKGKFVGIGTVMT